MEKEIILNGFLIHDKQSLFEEINRVLMANEDWEIGESLDALSDILYGGVGIIKGSEPIRLEWKNFAENEKCFGKAFTIKFYKEKLQHPEIFNIKLLHEKILELQHDRGQTYMQMILEIIAEHTHIKLVKS